MVYWLLIMVIGYGLLVIEGWFAHRARRPSLRSGRLVMVYWLLIMVIGYGLLVIDNGYWLWFIGYS